MLQAVYGCMEHGHVLHVDMQGVTHKAAVERVCVILALGEQLVGNETATQPAEPTYIRT